MMRIGICDDDPMVRQLLCNIVGSAPDLEVVVTCSSGEESLDVKKSVDMWLMDLRLPGISGRKVCQILTARGPAPKVLLLTAFGDDMVGETLRAGASGYLFKDGRPEGLVAAIRAVAAGFNVSSPDAMTSALREVPAPSPVLPASLENDEVAKTIIEQLLLGAGYAEIARNVHMSESGLKKRVAALMRRVGASSRPELMAKLYERDCDIS
ncbi:MAG: response regulator [Arachnia sp.]